MSPGGVITIQFFRTFSIKLFTVHDSRPLANGLVLHLHSMNFLFFIFLASACFGGEELQLWDADELEKACYLFRCVLYCGYVAI